LADDAIRAMLDKFTEDKKPDRDDLRYFLDKIIESCNGLHRGFTRSVVLMVALAGLFVLMSSGGLTEAELFGVKVSRFSLLLVVVPVAIAFTFSRAVTLLKTSIVYRTVFFGVTERYYPNWARSGLDSLLLTSYVNLGNTMHEQFFDPGVSRWSVSTMSIIEMVAVLFGPPAFDVYAYIVLFGSSEVAPAGVFVSAIVSGLLVVMGCVNALTAPFRTG
jgi:hypothetical protein